MKTTALCAFAVLLSAGAASAEALLSPGYYENIVKMPALGPKPMVTKTCLRKDEAKSVEEMLAQYSSDETCKFAQRTLGGGRIDIAASCRDDAGPSTIRMTGVYTATSYDLQIQHATKSERNMTMSAKSRRIAPTCPKGGR